MGRRGEAGQVKATRGEERLYPTRPYHRPARPPLMKGGSEAEAEAEATAEAKELQLLLVLVLVGNFAALRAMIHYICLILAGRLFGSQFSNYFCRATVWLALVIS